MEALGGLEGSNPVTAHANALLASAQGARALITQRLATMLGGQVSHQVLGVCGHKILAKGAGNTFGSAPLSLRRWLARGWPILLLQGRRLAVLAFVGLTILCCRFQVPYCEGILGAG